MNGDNVPAIISAIRDSNDHHRHFKIARKRRRRNYSRPCVKCNLALDSFSLKKGYSICSPCFYHHRNSSLSKRNSFRSPYFFSQKPSFRNRNRHDNTSFANIVIENSKNDCESDRHGFTNATNRNQIKPTNPDWSAENLGFADNYSSGGQQRVDVRTFTQSESVTHCNKQVDTCSVNNDVKTIVQYGMFQFSNQPNKCRVGDAGIVPQLQLVDSPFPPLAAYSLFPSVKISNQMLFNNSSSRSSTRPKSKKNSSLLNSSSDVVLDTTLKLNDNVYPEDYYSHLNCTSTNAQCKIVNEIVNEIVDNVDINDRAPNVNAENVDMNAIEHLPTDDVTPPNVSMPTVNIHPNEDAGVCSPLNKTSTETENGTIPFLAKSEPCEINGAGVPCARSPSPLPLSDVPEIIFTGANLRNATRSLFNSPHLKRAVVVKVEPVRISSCSPITEHVNTATVEPRQQQHCEKCQSQLHNNPWSSLSTLCEHCFFEPSSINEIVNSAADEPQQEQRCEKCHSLLEDNPRNSSSTLCERCIFDLPVPSVNNASRATVAQLNISRENSPPIEEVPQGENESKMLSRVESLSSLDLPSPEKKEFNDDDENVNNLSPPRQFTFSKTTTPPTGANRFPIPPNSTTTIRLCRICDDGSSGFGAWHIELHICDLCSRKLISRKRALEYVNSPASPNRHLADNEYLSVYAKRRRRNAPLGDNELFVDYARRKRR